MGLGHTWHGQCCDLGAWLTWSPHVDVWQHCTRVCQAAGIVLSAVLSLVCARDTCAFTAEGRTINGRMSAPGGSGQGVHWAVRIVVATFQ